MRADLERSGVFRMVDALRALDESASGTEPNGAAAAPMHWRPARSTRLADGRFDVRFKLWDVVKGSELGGQSNAVEAGRPAPGRAPHRRHIYEKLTGEKGVFSTRSPT